MTTPLLHYGRFERLGEKNIPKNNSDPVEAALAAYQQWLQVAKESGFVLLGSYNWEPDAVPEMLYREAVAAVKPIVAGITSGQLKQILKEISPAEDTGASGLFVSALHNASPVTQIEGTFSYRLLGYKLPPGKRIIALKDSTSRILGPHARGDTINFSDNFSSIHTAIAPYADGGLHINFGNVAEAGHRSRGGLFFNLGECGSIGDRSSTGIYAVNLGASHGISGLGKETFYLNLGSIDNHLTVLAQNLADDIEGTFISLSKAFGFTGPRGVVHDSSGNAFIFDDAGFKRTEYSPFSERLASKVMAAIRPLEILAENDYARKVELITQIDLPALKNEIMKLAGNELK